MRRKLSKKQIGAMGLAAMMAVQTPAMATETVQESATQEAAAQETTQELQTTEMQSEESFVEKVETAEAKPEEVETEELSTQEDGSETQTAELQSEEPIETSQESETAKSQQEEEIVAEASTEELIDQYDLVEIQEALTDGWHQDSNGNYKYVKDGVYLRNTIAEIDGSYYGFNYTGIMYANTYFQRQNSESRGQFWYRAKADGRLYVNEWYIPENNYENPSYYGDEGKAYCGLHEVDGSLYYFDEWGYAYVSCAITTETGENYYCDATGKATKVENNSWFETDGKYLYVKDGKFLKDCTEKIENAYYGFDNRGIMYVDTEFNIWNSESKCRIYYRAKEDGRLYANEWYIYENSAKCYYGEDAKQYEGLHTIDGKQYYFSPVGRLYHNLFVTSDDGTLYYCDADGVAIMPTNNSWGKVDENYYYVKDGKLLKGCVEQIDGIYYGFDSYGFLYVDRDFSIFNSETQKNDYYRAKADGSLYINEWYIYDLANQYYYGENGKRYSGFHTIDGKKYYFSEWGWFYKSTTFTDKDGTLYYFGEDGAATEVEDNSWAQINEKWYYIKNGKLLKGCVEEIGNHYYGFNAEGAMYFNCKFSIWHTQTGICDYYQAKADGSLYVNEWYSNSLQYYGEDGKAYIGLQTVDGKQYYFGSDGSVQRYCIVSENGKNYYCDSNGIAVELQNNQWTKVGNDPYYYYVYVKDGKPLKNCVAEIDGIYYGFDSFGHMYRNTEFNFWDSEVSNQAYYWASVDGSLYTNRWGNHCYYGSDGKRCTGVQTIDGVQYGFNENGIAVQSGFVMTYGAVYYCDAEGRVVDELSDDQWYYSEDGYWYYVQNGELVRSCSIEINGKQYRFSWNGRMETQGADINEDGSLRSYTNTWVYTGRYWEYYGEDGQPYKNGIYEIAGAKYHFKNGYMSESDLVSDGDNYYVADASGHLTPIPDIGWVLAGSDYYYVQNGAFVKFDIRKINDAYYAFDYNGKMYANGEYKFKSITCRARADGSLYVSQWYQDTDGRWYYYDQDANLVSNKKVEINKATYLFDTKGALKTNGVIQEGENYYLADENGIWVQTPGWVSKGGCWYYVRNDGSLCKGLLEDGNAYYYLNPIMETNVELELIDGILYNIDADGHLVTAPDGFYHKMVNSDTIMADVERKILDYLYYVSDGKVPEKGWKSIDGSWYYFDVLEMNGICRPVVDCTYKIDGKYYLFNTDGTMLSNGWKLVGDVLYYAYASGELATGDVTINGTVYHFNEKGVMQEENEKKTGIVVEDGICKLYSEDGILLETGNGQGWSLLDGDYYYLEGDIVFMAGSYKLPDGKWYLFDDNGRMLSNVFDENDDGVLHWYGESGAAQTGWFIIAGNWYYGSPISGTLYKGLRTINGVNYYFDDDGIMQTTSTVADGRVIVINSSGVVTDMKALEDGWSCYNGEWYYYQNRNPYTGWVGDYYVYEGHMCCNAVVPYYASGDRYYAGEDGTYQRNAWCGDGRYYAKADGMLAQNEWLTIDGKQYYFNTYSVKSTEKLTENGIFTEDGQYLAPDGYDSGWILIDGDYYYKEGEDFVSNQVKKINGDWYLFDIYGKMVTGFAVPTSMPNFWYGSSVYDGGYYYYAKDGRRQSYTGWQLIDGKWYYFDEYSRATTGWRTINGVKYYFGTTTEIRSNKGYVSFVGNPDHFMYKGYQVIDGEFYYFDANGVCQGIERTYTGWHSDDSGKWYYIRNGHAVTGTSVIDGTLYKFDDTGIWIF